MIEEKEQLVLDSRGVDGLFVDICELLFFERMLIIWFPGGYFIDWREFFHLLKIL